MFTTILTTLFCTPYGIQYTRTAGVEPIKKMTRTPETSNSWSDDWNAGINTLIPSFYTEHVNQEN
jgi:hypothetical protein